MPSSQLHFFSNKHKEEEAEPKCQSHDYQATWHKDDSSSQAILPKQTNKLLIIVDYQNLGKLLTHFFN